MLSRYCKNLGTNTYLTRAATKTSAIVFQLFNIKTSLFSSLSKVATWSNLEKYFWTLVLPEKGILEILKNNNILPQVFPKSLKISHKELHI